MLQARAQEAAFALRALGGSAVKLFFRPSVSVATTRPPNNPSIPTSSNCNLVAGRSQAVPSSASSVFNAMGASPAKRERLASCAHLCKNKVHMHACAHAGVCPCTLPAATQCQRAATCGLATHKPQPPATQRTRTCMRQGSMRPSCAWQGTSAAPGRQLIAFRGSRSRSLITTRQHITHTRWHAPGRRCTLASNAASSTHPRAHSTALSPAPGRRADPAPMQ